MQPNKSLLSFIIFLALNACSSDRNLEDPIRAIQNGQAFRDANAAKLPRIDVPKARDSFPDEKETLKPALATDFDIDQATGKINFKAEVIYFENDDASLTKAGMQQLESLAQYMREHAETKLIIEGHCDQRGSVEYNLALGQRRSDSVRKHLATLNVSIGRLASVSFGKEKPAAAGDSEEALAKNRRVEFAFKIDAAESSSKN